MNLIILDDKLENPLGYADYLKRSKSFKIEKIVFLYYQHDREDLNAPEDAIQLYKDMDIDVQHIDSFCFFKVMNSFYDDCTNIFLYDFELKGDDVPDIYRIQIGYAKNKINSKGDVDRFFFYTTRANSEQLSNLRKFFPEHVLNAECIEQNNCKTVSINFEENENFVKVMKDNNKRGGLT